MAMGKYSRGDGRKSSHYCSTVSIVVFVGLCLVGVWVLMSSSVVPVQHSDLPNQETKIEVKQKAKEKFSGQFEDNSGNLSEDAIKEEGTSENSSSVQDNHKLLETDTDNSDEEKFVKEGTKTQNDSGGELKESENDGDEQVEDTESKKVSENEGDERNEDQESNSGASSDSREVESNSDGEESNEGEKDSNSSGGKLNTGDESPNTDENDTQTEGDDKSANDQKESENSSNENEANTDEGENKTDTDEEEKEAKVNNQIEEKVDENQDKDSEQIADDRKLVGEEKGEGSNEVFPTAAQSEILNEATTQSGSWSTQATESRNEKESQKSLLSKDQNGYKWKLCNVTTGADYIPCLDNVQAIRNLPSTKHYEHRERHCPDEAPTCLVPLPEGYKQSIKWPRSREQIWYHNIPHSKLAEVKGHQNWVKVTGDYLSFPGGGTQFKNGALHYIDFIQQSLPKIAWGKQSRVILDVGCGVASFGGYLFEKDVLAMSFAPKDEHEAQIQFALERGIPAISAVMGTKRLPFPSNIFDAVHCARCRVPWHIEGGKLLLELNRLLRPGGYFLWSATPVYQKLPEDVGIWKAMTALTKSMCWDLKVVKNDKLNSVGVAIFRKPTSNHCYEKRPQNEPPLCQETDAPNAAWNVQLQPCMHKVPVDASKRGSQWPEQWPKRLEKPPYWLKSQVGIYGKEGPDDFTADYEHWKRVVSVSYLNGFGINWSSVRNVMDMRAVYGGFAAALKDLKVWVMNVVPIESADTLPIIYERGLFGIYHDWCESFSTYPRTYDLLHADHLFSDLKKRCKLEAVIVEVDRILRPKGTLIVRDNVETIEDVQNMAKSLHWKMKLTYSKDNESLLCVEKTLWRPMEVETILSAVA